MSHNKALFKQIISIEVGILIVGIFCLIPTAIIIARFPVSREPVAAPVPQAPTPDVLSTVAAEIISTQNAPLQADYPKDVQIPLTGPTPTDMPSDGLLRVTFINAGQGDAILIQSPDGKFGLIDGGPAGGGTLEYLVRHGVNRLDLMIATVPRAEHLGGLVEVLRAIPVNRVLTNGQASTDPMYQEFLTAISQSGAQYFQTRRGDAIPFGSLRLDVLHPGSIINQDININSLVLRLALGKTVFLFMGDANNVADQEILASVYPLRSTIIKVGHHAGPDSTSSAFLTGVDPEVAIYSPGTGVDYDLPSADTLAALTKINTAVYDTQINGTIMVVADAAGYALATEFETPLAPLPTATPAAIVPADISVVVTQLTSPIRPGENASFAVETSPGAVCSNIMKFSVGQGGITNLGMKAADDAGRIVWSWQVAPNAMPASFMIEVLCGLKGKSAGGVIPFVVAR